MGKKKEGIFRFKYFSAKHERSSIKIGVDAVALAAWVDIPVSGKIIDVGTGCGVIALICAQRSLDAEIDAIDVDSDSISEASENFSNSPWIERLHADKLDFLNLNNKDFDKKYDLIISNPPFYESGVNPEESARFKARHKGTLSPESLVEKGSDLINPNGIIAFILPSDQSEHIVKYAEKFKLYPRRHLMMADRYGKLPKRYLVEFSKIFTTYSAPEVLYIKERENIYTSDYKNMCKDFYLAF